MSRAEIHSHREKAERFGPDIDTAYEQDLRACAELGHEPRIVVCPRCGEDFGSIPEEWYDR